MMFTLYKLSCLFAWINLLHATHEIPRDSISCALDYFAGFHNVRVWHISHAHIVMARVNGDYEPYNFLEDVRSGEFYDAAQVHKRKMEAFAVENAMILKASWQNKRNDEYYLHLFYKTNTQQITWKIIMPPSASHPGEDYEIETTATDLPPRTNHFPLKISFDWEIDSNIMVQLNEDKHTQCLQTAYSYGSPRRADNVAFVHRENNRDALQRPETAKVPIVLELEGEIRQKDERLDALQNQIQSLKKQLRETGDQSSNWFWYCIIGGCMIVTVLIMLGVFRIYYWYQKQKWEVKKIGNFRNVRTSTKPVIPAILNRQTGRKSVVEELSLEIMNDMKKTGEIKLWKDPEPFDNLMRSSVVVQDAVMNDIHDEMETEGGKGTKKTDIKALDF